MSQLMKEMWELCTSYYHYLDEKTHMFIKIRKRMC